MGSPGDDAAGRPRGDRRLPRRGGGLRSREGGRACAGRRLARNSRSGEPGATRPLWLGQDNAVARTGRPRRADGGQRQMAWASPCFPGPREPRRRPCAGNRLRLPGREPAPLLHGVRERRLFGAARRRVISAAADGSARAGRALGEGRSPARRALRGRGAAGRDRARLGAAAGAAALRRADRPPRLRHRREGARPDRRPPGRAWLLARRRHPRRRRRGAAAPRAGARGRRRRPRGALVRVAAPLAFAELVRAPVKTAVRVLTLAAAVGLLAAMLLFVGHSLGTMTSNAVRGVPLDWQGPVGTARAATTVASRVGRQAGIAEAVPAATAPFAGVEHVSPGVGKIRSGGGSILAVPPSYLAHIHTFRFLRGSLRPGQVVFDQQLAATLQVQPGDVVTLKPHRGSRPVRLRVSGIALVTAADQLFQPLNPLIGPAPAQPPADIAILPFDTFATRIAPSLPSISSASGTSAVPDSQTGTQWQVQTQIDPAALTGSPAHALAQATQLRNRVERSLPGQVVFVDNLADNLNAAAGDALYAETLYIMLAVPGALVALGLAYLAALGTAERDRRNLALLRARGARRRDLVWLAALESLALGLLAGPLGTGFAFAALHLTGTAAGTGPGRLLVTLAVSIALAAAGAAAARVATSIAAFRASVDESRRSVQRPGRPLWQRLYLDLIALAVAGLVYWLTARTGFSAVVNPDSNPTLSLSVYMFLAPALLWIGATLLLVRLRGRFVAWLAARVAGARA